MNNHFLGKWRITWMENWDQAFVDLDGPGYFQFDKKDQRLQAWAEMNRIRIDYIQPGKPQQHAYVERYNRTVRYDWLGQHLFENLEEVSDYATKWLWTYNNERPNMGIGSITPRQKLKSAA